MSDIDTIRWGDAQTLEFFRTPGEGGAIAQTTKQLVNAEWSRPLTWRLMVFVQPKLPAAEGSTFLVTLNLLVGVGGAMLTTPQVLTFVPVAGAYPPQTVFFDIPAQTIRLSVTVDETPAGQTTAASWLIGAFCAPRTEPAGYTEIRNLLVDALSRNPMTDNYPDRAGLERWMPPGFNDGELQYRR